MVATMTALATFRRRHGISAEVVDFEERRARRIDRIQQLRWSGIGVPEVALLMRVSPELVERVAPTYRRSVARFGL